MKKKTLLLTISIFILLLFSSCTVEDERVKEPEEAKMALIDSSVRTAQLLCRNFTPELASKLDGLEVNKSEDGEVVALVNYVSSSLILNNQLVIENENDVQLNEAKNLLKESKILGTFSSRSYLNGAKGDKQIYNVNLKFIGNDDLSAISFTIINNTITLFSINNEAYDLSYYPSISID